MSKPRYRPSEQSRPDSLQSGGTRATETPGDSTQVQATNHQSQGNNSQGNNSQGNSDQGHPSATV